MESREKISWGYMKLGMKLGDSLPYSQEFTMQPAYYLFQKFLGDHLIKPT